MVKIKLEKTDETIERARELRTDGWSWRRIGTEMGVSGQHALDLFGTELADLPDPYEIARTRAADLRTDVLEYVNRRAPVSRVDVMEEFGLTDSQLDRLRLPDVLTARAPKAPVTLWTDEEVMAAIRLAYVETGQEYLTVARYEDWYRGRARGSMISLPMICNREGGWLAACERAGIPGGPTLRQDYTRRWSQDDCVAVVSEYVEDCIVLGIRPTFVGYDRDQMSRDDWPSGSTLRNILGIPWAGMLELSVARRQ